MPTWLSPQSLAPTVQAELEIIDPVGSDDSEMHKRLETFRKQAQLLVKGSQDSNADLPYLVDSLRETAGMKRTWGTSGVSEDEERLRGIKAALALVEGG